MQSEKKHDVVKCRYKHLPNQAGLALIAIGNSLRGDDGIASVLCDALPEQTKADICRFDLGPYTGLLPDCLSGHEAAIIIDSTSNGTAPGTVSILNLSTILEGAYPIYVRCCHGFSLIDELRVAKKSGMLPKRLVFFGIEVNDVNWSDKVTPALQEMMPQLVGALTRLISTISEGSNRHA